MHHRLEREIFKGRPVPIIEVTYDDTIREDELHRLLDLLPDVVAEGVACPEEPWVGPPLKGDFQVRFHRKSALDSFDLNCVIEVRTKLFPSRRRDKQERADRMREQLGQQLDLGDIGLWLVLSDGAWSQSD